ncbi:MAG: VOC family protein [Solirubrobacteraceae bacterium]
MPKLLEGIHHITAITADAPRNVDFYARVLGLRLVKKTVNFDAPDVYHLYYGDEAGSPGSILTFFEFPGAARGRPGAGMIHRIGWRVGSETALDFWASRLGGEGVASEREGNRLRFADPEGLGLELVHVQSGDPPLVAAAEGVPSEYALQGFDGARAYTTAPERSAALLDRTLGFERDGDGDQDWVCAGEARGAGWRYDPPPPERGLQGAGTVHHIAWASRDDAHQAWLDTVTGAGAHATPIIDRQYFRSIYFREPSGVLFEIATLGPGFAIDEDPEHLGEALRLPPQHEHLRERLERTLTPLTNPRAEPVA